MKTSSLILASTSPYRRAQLDKLGLRFAQISPDVDETPRPGELPVARASRLAGLKAQSVVAHAPPGYGVVIGSDQVCHFNGEIFRKPGDFDRARQHLTRFSGQWVSFTTGLTLIDTEGHEESGFETISIHFRRLSQQTITRYLDIEQPFDCAGAIKVEGLGITLLSDMRGRDVNSLVGLPLMLLNELLERYNLSIIDFTLR